MVMRGGGGSGSAAATCGFAGLGQEFLDELGGLHSLMLHPGSEELEGEVLGLAFVELVVVDQAQDEPALFY